MKKNDEQHNKIDKKYITVGHAQCARWQNIVTINRSIWANSKHFPYSPKPNGDFNRVLPECAMRLPYKGNDVFFYSYIIYSCVCPKKISLSPCNMLLSVIKY